MDEEGKEVEEWGESEEDKGRSDSSTEVQNLEAD